MIPSEAIIRDLNRGCYVAVWMSDCRSETPDIIFVADRNPLSDKEEYLRSTRRMDGTWDTEPVTPNSIRYFVEMCICTRTCSRKGMSSGWLQEVRQ